MSRFCDAIIHTSTAGILSGTLDSERKEKRVFCLCYGTETAAEWLIVAELDDFTNVINLFQIY